MAADSTLKKHHRITAKQKIIANLRRQQMSWTESLECLETVSEIRMHQRETDDLSRVSVLHIHPTLLLMTNESNDLNQPIDFPVADWTPPPFPPHKFMEGRFCRLEPLSIERHATSLYKADSGDREGASWTYLPYGPFTSEQDYVAWMTNTCYQDDPQFYAIIDLKDNSATGIVSHLRIDPRKGSIEVGHVHYSPRLQKTRAATEAIYLLMSQAFELGYRRYEWKCHALNAASRAAARRFGFSFEGIFRQAAVVKGRNRDTAWHAIIDAEWPVLQAAFERWLSPSNFDDSGQQKERLSTLTAPIAKGHLP